MLTGIKANRHQNCEYRSNTNSMNLPNKGWRANWYLWHLNILEKHAEYLLYAISKYSLEWTSMFERE